MCICIYIYTYRYISTYYICIYTCAYLHNMYYIHIHNTYPYPYPYTYHMDDILQIQISMEHNAPSLCLYCLVAAGHIQGTVLRSSGNPPRSAERTELPCQVPHNLMVEIPHFQTTLMVAEHWDHLSFKCSDDSHERFIILVRCCGIFLQCRVDQRRVLTYLLNAIEGPPTLQSSVIPAWNYVPQLLEKVTPTSSLIVNAARKWKSTKKLSSQMCKTQSERKSPQWS